MKFWVSPVNFFYHHLQLWSLKTLSPKLLQVWFGLSIRAVFIDICQIIFNFFQIQKLQQLQEDEGSQVAQAYKGSSSTMLVIPLLTLVSKIDFAKRFNPVGNLLQNWYAMLCSVLKLKYKLKFWFQLSQLSGYAVQAEKDEKKNCSELGFNTPNLMCSDCETLGRFQVQSTLLICHSYVLYVFWGSLC